VGASASGSGREGARGRGRGRSGGEAEGEGEGERGKGRVAVHLVREIAAGATRSGIAGIGRPPPTGERRDLGGDLAEIAPGQG